MRIRSPRNFWAGLMFVAFGLFFLIGARHYTLGTAARMGPAYFPMLVAGALTIIGAVVTFQSFVIQGPKVAAVRTGVIVYISVALVLFGYLLKPLGMAAALLLLVVVSAYAGREFRLKEVLLLSAALIVLSVLVFINGLGLPFTIWPAFLTN